MIDESGPWKDELLRVASSLERRIAQRRWTERSRFIVERDIMISAYSIRKLLEASKLSDEARARRISATRFTLIDRVPDFLNFHRVNDYYDLEHASSTQLRVPDFCNQIIHSFVWMMCENESRGFAGVIVASDRERRKCLYQIAAEAIIDFFRAIAADDIVEMRIRADSSGERKVIYASSEQREYQI